MKVVTIGRSKENNDIVVNDEKVSRNHLQMIMDDNGNYSVQDLDSTNGTFVNGRRISGKVPLKVTDELKIGNTVLSWQCYFGSQPNTGTNNPVPPQVPISQAPPVSPQQPKVDPPTPKRWLIYVIIGAVVLLLAGCVIGWLIYQDEPTQTEISAGDSHATINETEMELVKAQAAADKADREYAEAMQKALEQQKEAERLEKIAAQSNSEKDKKAAELARTEANKMQKEADTAKKGKEEAEKQVKELESQVTSLKNELATTKDNLTKANTESKKAKASLENTNTMQKILNKWTDKNAYDFCQSQSPKWSCTKDNAKDMITDKFSKLQNDEKEKEMINKMKNFKFKETGKEKDGTNQSNTKPIPELQPAPSDNSTTPSSSTTQPASSQPQPDSNN